MYHLRIIFKHTSIAMIAMVCLWACSSHNKNWNLSQDELIANALMGSDSLDCFYFSDDDSLKKNKETFHLMNRIMQMYDAVPDSGVDLTRYYWLWESACSKEIAQYSLSKYGRKTDFVSENLFDSVRNDISNMLGFYTAGSQAEMNTYTFVMATMEMYRTMRLYKELQQLFPHKTYKDAVFQDYVQWIFLYSKLSDRFSTDIQGEQSYSMMPLEANWVAESICKFRCKELSDEIKIMKGYRYDSKNCFDWVDEEDFKRQQLWYANYSRDENEKLKAIPQTDSVYFYLDKWMDSRYAVANTLKDKSVKNAYANYDKKVKFDILWLEMNKMGYLDDSLIYGILDGIEPEEVNRTDKNLYLPYNGKYYYMNTCYDSDLYDAYTYEPHTKVVVFENYKVKAIKPIESFIKTDSSWK